MLIFHVILALAAVTLLALRPRSVPAALAVAGLAGCDVALGASVAPAVGIIAPLLAFLGAAMTLARLVERSGLAERAASALAARAQGSSMRLYALVCVLCVALTAAVSLDGAVVLMVPVILVLADRFNAPTRPLFLGVVTVANAASIAVPQGNPTNLVLIARLHLSPTAFATHMLLPGLLAAALCAAAVALTERRALAASYRSRPRPRTPLSRAERHAAISLAVAAAAAWTAPFVGIAPWWPFTAVVVLALAVRRRRPPLIFPWRIATQLGALLILIGSLGLTPPTMPLGLPGLLAIAGAVGAAAALINNLPASVWATSLLAGRSGYAASIGLAIGALATPQGSVATLIASDLAGEAAPPVTARRFALIAATALTTATLLLWAGL
jgi:Na+/H+ antiporter NhaD/arsenite permease-like protein